MEKLWKKWWLRSSKNKAHRSEQKNQYNPMKSVSENEKCNLEQLQENQYETIMKSESEKRKVKPVTISGRTLWKEKAKSNKCNLEQLHGGQ